MYILLREQMFVYRVEDVAHSGKRSEVDRPSVRKVVRETNDACTRSKTGRRETIPVSGR